MLRKRKNRRYNETQDEEGDGERKFDLQEQIKSTRFDECREKHLQDLPGEAITLRLIQRNGFEKPILVTKPDGLDLRVPPKSFLVRDVRNYVGHHRTIDVMDVKTQKNIEMSMKDWCKYYESKSRDRLLNVISLEFSHTKLDELVDSPMIVKLLDWVDLVWPKFLKLSQTESTNTIDRMKYPKVQKYCLMSVKGSYTDFHIDFGGTSVWYHILKGRKIFWMVPPTELNLQTFEEWTLSGMQQDVFFGDTVEECFRVELRAGNTFFIPSGWIHAVYTLEDSLVFGGNFLHSYGIENQLKVSKIEDATKVPVKFRYPFYTEILWYVVQHYVYCLANKDHLHRPDYEAAEAQMALAISKAAQEKTESSSMIDDVDDETTESEHEEIVTSANKRGNNKKTSNNVKRKRQTKPQRTTPKRAKKQPPPPPSDEDDESTDIDSANEDYVKPPEKPTTNTCRMTKNSLLRLQYEIDERQQQHASSSLSKTKQDNGSNSGSGKSTATKKKTTTSSSATSSSSPPEPEKVTQSNQSSATKPVGATTTTTTTTITGSNTLNLADIVLSHEKKLNGWSSSGSAAGGQSIWSNPNNESSEPIKIHITKFEVNGLKLLVKHLSKLSGAKKNLPNLIRNSRALLDDCKKLIAEHENDDPELAITGKPITVELLRPKKTDMNELIGQFFKPSEETAGNEEQVKSASTSPVKGNSSSTTSAHPLKSAKFEPITSSPTKTRTETSTQQQRLKNNSRTDSPAAALSKGDEKKGSNIASNSSNAIESDVSKTSLSSSSSTSSPHKETKCLSPNKKLSSASGIASTSSPPPRPKSPPTRPLSMNQYTSKTKNENNLLLPGSFADLIAATSTEKKVFDVSGADVASSLYGIKDLPSNSSSSATKSSNLSSNKATGQKDRSRQRSVSSSSSGSGSNIKTTGSATTSPIIASSSGSKNSVSHDSSTTAAIGSGGSGAGTRITKDPQQPHQHYQPNKPNSPEPPKVPPAQQKRFISPNFKPPNKEKLIYASAPYISPVHASDPSRSGSHQYPWQTPVQRNAPSYSSTPARTPSHSSSAPSTTNQTPPSASIMPGSSSGGSSTTSNQAPYTPDARGFVAQSHLLSPGQGRDFERNKLQHQSETHSTSLNTAEQRSSSPMAGDREKTQVNVIVKSNQQQEQQNCSAKEHVSKTDNCESKSIHSNLNPVGIQQPSGSQSAAKAVNDTVKLAPNAATQSASASTAEAISDGGKQQQQTATTNEPEQSAKKPTKPRGPPKKSKEARQVIESTPEPVNSPITSSVIRAGPSFNSPTVVVPPAAPPSVVPPPQTKTKAKRTKKSKDTDSNNRQVFIPAAPITSSVQAQPQPLLTTMAPNQVRPSVICGLVRPIVTQSQQLQQQQQQQTQQQQMPPIAVTSGSKINPQSYIISRPLFSFNSMPTFSAAQFQQMQQQQQKQQQQQQQHPRPMNLLTAPISSPLGLPTLQQGARIVWATQPRKLAPMGTTNPPPGLPLAAPSTAKGASTSRPPISSPSDNAALLSLATTALSTAPMASSPALSHLSNRAPAPQAIMMSSAATTMAGQQQALFAAAGQQFLRPFMPMTHLLTRPGAPRPSGQLVFARLPPNQGQPRYLITQPGFMQQRFQTPHIVTTQPTSTLAFATYKPPTEPPKAMKTKKVKTS